MVVARLQCGLKWSNGSRQARHLNKALQAVEPKWETSVVWVEAQRGQATDVGARARTKRRLCWSVAVALAHGGAMP
jgi:hypothetical protein